MLLWNQLSSALHLIIKSFQHEKTVNVEVQYRNKVPVLFQVLCDN